MENEDAQFIKGFNSGWLLEKHEPELLSKVLKGQSLSNDYLAGLNQGQQEYKQELTRNELDEINKLRESRKDQDRDISL